MYQQLQQPMQRGAMQQSVTPAQTDWLYRSKQARMLDQADELLNSFAQRTMQDRQGALDAAVQGYGNQYDTWSARILPWLQQWSDSKTSFDQDVLPYTSDFWNSINNNPNPENVALYVGPPKYSAANVTDVRPIQGYNLETRTSDNPDFK